MAGENTPEGTLIFPCPDNCSKLWLVVSGAPQEHWKHEWDDDNSNDEQWPYQVKFEQTNLLGEVTQTRMAALTTGQSRLSPVMTRRSIKLPGPGAWRITDLAGKQLHRGYGDAVALDAYINGSYILHYRGRPVRILKTP